MASDQRQQLLGQCYGRVTEQSEGGYGSRMVVAGASHYRMVEVMVCIVGELISDPSHGWEEVPLYT